MINAAHVVALFGLLTHKYKDHTRYSGDSRDICSQIIEELWSGTYLQTGLGHFNYFWMRDFGSVCAALAEIGQKDKAVATLEWALSNYKKHNAVTTCILGLGWVFDVPKKSIDSLPWLLNSIVELDLNLSESDKSFLQDQLDIFIKTYLHADTGMVKKNVKYAELRDAVIYKQSAYTTCLLSLMVRASKRLGLDIGVLAKHDYQKMLYDLYWNGNYFNADLDNDAFSIECNLFAIKYGYVKDALHAHSIIDYVFDNELTALYPTVYTKEPERFKYRLWEGFLVPHYAATTIWTWHGGILLQILKTMGRTEFKAEKDKFERLITTHKNFPELLHSNGEWYRTKFYKAAPGMIWSALYLTL